MKIIKMRRFIEKYSFNAVLIVTLTIIGCASPAKVHNMVVPPHETSFLMINDELKDNVHLSEVSGGEQTNPLWTSEIGNPEFKAALLQSLKDAHFLGTAEASNYFLYANLLKVEQPFAGINLKVITNVEYILIEKNSRKKILRKTIIASYTAGFDDSVLAVKRLRLANEGSARKNIYELLKTLSELKIEKHQVSISM